MTSPALAVADGAGRECQGGETGQAAGGARAAEIERFLTASSCRERGSRRSIETVSLASRSVGPRSPAPRLSDSPALDFSAVRLDHCALRSEREARLRARSRGERRWFPGDWTLLERVAASCSTDIGWDASAWGSRLALAGLVLRSRLRRQLGRQAHHRARSAGHWRSRTTSEWDDALVRHRVFERLSQLAPALVVFAAAPVLFPERVGAALRRSALSAARQPLDGARLGERQPSRRSSTP